MTARFRSAFFGSSGFVAVSPQARVIAAVQNSEERRERRVVERPCAAPACHPQAEAA